MGTQARKTSARAGAIRMTDSAWDEITLPDIINCWDRSLYLPPVHVDRVKCIANNTEGSHLESPAVNEAMAVQLASAYELVHLLTLPSTPLVDIVNDVSGFISSSTMQQILNAEEPDQSRLQDTLTDSEIHDLFDTREDILSEDSEDSDASLSYSDNADDLSRVIYHLQKVPRISDVLMNDICFRELLVKALGRGQQIQNC